LGVKYRNELFGDTSLKIIITSDIHLGNLAEIESPFFPPEPCDQIEHQRFADEIHALKPDVLVVAGDCAESCMWDGHLKTFFEMYKNPHGVSIAIQGNHDCWLSLPVRQTHEEKFQDFFIQAKKNGWKSLKDVPWSNDGVWIAGGMGWYDFSSADPEVVQGMLPHEIDARRGWSDYGRMRMNSALDVCKLRMAEFESNLKQVPPSSQRKALIVVSHFVGVSRLLQKFGEQDWGAGFMGNWNIGRLAIEAEANFYCCGHSHRRAEFQLGNTRCVNIGSGYGRGSKRYEVIDL